MKDSALQVVNRSLSSFAKDKPKINERLEILKNLRISKFGTKGKFQKFSDEHLLYLTDPANIEIWKDLSLADIYAVFKKHFGLGPEFQISPSHFGRIFSDFNVKRPNAAVNANAKSEK